MDGIKIETDNRSGIMVLQVQGYIDTTTSPELERSLQALLKQKSHQIVISTSCYIGLTPIMRPRPLMPSVS